MAKNRFCEVRNGAGFEGSKVGEKLTVWDVIG